MMKNRFLSLICCASGMALGLPVAPSAQAALPAAELSAELATQKYDLYLEPEAPSRSERKFGLSAIFGFNSLAGGGLMGTINMAPRFSTDLAAGVGAQGLRLGLQARYNVLTSNWTPFLAAGLQANSGMQNRSGRLMWASPEASGDARVSARTHRSVFAVPTLGASYQGNNGLMFMAGVGYAVQIAGRAPEYAQSNLSSSRANQVRRLVLGSAPVATLSIGKAF